jgi:hypothetical protein
MDTLTESLASKSQQINPISPLDFIFLLLVGLSHFYTQLGLSKLTFGHWVLNSRDSVMSADTNRLHRLLYRQRNSKETYENGKGDSNFE